eukprot:scaffold3153_cov243-Pinguiococcus_pyrenoidosus.AAC.2
MADYSDVGTVNYYPTTADYDAFKPFDLIPENKDHYARDNPLLRNAVHGKKDEVLDGEDITISRCKIETPEDGGAWHIQRVGPFLSTGGYDWWQIGWSDGCFMTEALERHPEGVDVDKTILVPVTEEGERIGHPPVHIHHIHFVEQSGVRHRQAFSPLCSLNSGSRHVDSYLKEKQCYNSSLFFEQHGDYECVLEDDGIDCLTTVHNPPRRIRQAMDVEGELNDVRPFDSDKMRWYYQTAIHWKPMAAPEEHTGATSQMTIMAPPMLDTTSQLSRFVTFPSPTAMEAFMWYTGTMWAKGELIRNKLHSHAMTLGHTEFFAAAPEDLGLDDPRFSPGSAAGATTDVVKLGFKDHTALTDFIFQNLEQSQRRYQEKCVDGLDLKHPMCSRPRPRFVCAAAVHHEEFEIHAGKQTSFTFDRTPNTHCEPWEFEIGHPFTVTAFNRIVTKPVAPHVPNSVPPTIPQHVSWHMWYNHKQWFHSFFGRIVCNQEGVFFDARRGFDIVEALTIAISVNGLGSIPRTNTAFRVAEGLTVVIMVLCVLAMALLARRKPKKL